MEPPIPNLRAAGEDARRLYSMYLGRLSQHGLHERIATVCPIIRRYAAGGPGVREGLFTYHYELEALCELKRFTAAWRRLRQQARAWFGRRFDLRGTDWQ